MLSLINKKEMERLLETLAKAIKLDGDVSECGVFEGGTAKEILRCCPDKTVHLFDVFGEFPNLRTPYELKYIPNAKLRIRGQVDALIKSLDKLGLTNYEIHQGEFSNTFPSFDKPLCFIHGDADLYVSTKQICELANRLLVPGGYLVIHDYGQRILRGVTIAISEAIDMTKYELSVYEHQATLRKL